MPATVRSARTGDLERITGIYAHWVEHTVMTFDLEPPRVEDFRSRWDAAQEANHPWLVTELNGAVAGYATASAFRPKPAYRSTVETTIYLEQSHLGEGLGRPLYETLLDTAAERGFHLATAGITLPNPASVRLHEALGFAAVGVFREVGHKLGAWRDVGWWQRTLVHAPGMDASARADLGRAGA